MTEHEKNVQLIAQRLQLISCPDMKPGELLVTIAVNPRKAAIYCHVDTTPEKLASLVDQHADAIAEHLSTWGIN